MGDMDQRLGSRYMLKERLGRGAMGTVWRAVNTDTGQPVAVKVLSEELSDEPDMLTRFIQERNTLISVSHPNLVRIHDLVVEDGRLAIVMDLVNGPDLHRHLAERGVLSLAEAAVIGRGVADALTAIHSAGIIHRDLKPANILLDLGGPQPVPKLVDFGIARMIASSRLTSRSSVVGTPQYLSPEAISGTEPSPSLDVYALGIALYELLTGTPPFHGEQLLQVLNQHMYQEPPWPASIPPQILPLLQAMLAKDPQLRPTAAQVSAQLNTLGAGAGAVFPNVAPVIPTQQPQQPQLPAQQGWQPGGPVPQSPVPGAPMPTPLPQQTPIGYGPGTPHPGAPGTPLPGGYGTPGQSPLPAPSPSGFFYPNPDMFDPNNPASTFTPSPAPFTEDMFQAKKPKRNNKRLALVGGGVAVVAVAGVVLALTLGGGNSPAPKPIATGTGSAAVVAACPAETSVGVPASARWTLAGSFGDCSLAPSTTDSLTPANGASFGSAGSRGQVLEITGGSAIATVPNNSIVNTANSFTVSIWVNLTSFDKSKYSTVLAIQGKTEDAFTVEYNPGWGSWAFNHTTVEGPSAQWVAAAGKTVPQTNTWTHLVGVYDSSGKTMTLYVDGAQVVQRTGVTAWNGDNEIVLGANVNQSGAAFAPMTGQLSDLQIFDSALTAKQVAAIP
ncbi:MAG TPA: protein kinase [Actinospica sp.]|nr:protein kinase [Actinospica sp.]